MTYSFEDIVGDETDFFSEYFNKKPMLRARGLPGNPRDLLSIRLLDELIHLEIIRPPYIKVNLNGEGTPEKGYTRNVVVQGETVTGVVDPDRIYELYRIGATIAWSSLNHIVPHIRDLSRTISQKLAVRTDPVGFLTPGGHEGYPPHHDPVDLFILQLEGTKHWRLWNPRLPRLGGNGQYSATDLGEPAIQVSLQPGDVLYLPYGTPHAAAAENEASLHLSVMMRPRMWRDLLRESFEQITQDPEYVEYPHIGDRRTASVEEAFKDKLQSAALQLAAVNPVDELNRLAELGRHAVGTSAASTFQSVSTAASIGPDTRLRRTTVPIEFGSVEGGRTRVNVNGNKVAVPDLVATTLAALDFGSSIKAVEVFPGVSPARSAKTAQGLTRLGVFEVLTGA